MAAPELERLWGDPQYWTPPGIYRCPADPRVIVPKRRRWAGWTINFAHRMAWAVLVGSIVIAIGPMLALVMTRSATPLAALAGVGASLVVLSLLAAWESERPH